MDKQILKQANETIEVMKNSEATMSAERNAGPQMNPQDSVNMHKTIESDMEEVKLKDTDMSAFTKERYFIHHEPAGEGVALRNTEVLEFAKEIEKAARFFKSDTDDKSLLFKNAQDAVELFLESTKMVEAATDRSLYDREFLMAKSAVSAYYEKNKGWKFTSKGRRRRDNMKKLLDAFEDATLPSIDMMPKIDTIQAVEPYLYDDVLEVAQNDYDQIEADMEKYQIIGVDGGLTITVLDHEEAKRVIEKGSFKERYFLLMKVDNMIMESLKYTKEYGKGEDNLTEKYGELEALKEELVTKFSRAYMEENHKLMMKMRFTMDIILMKKVVDEYNKALEKAGIVPGKEPTQEQKNLAKVLLVNSNVSELYQLHHHNQGVFFDSRYFDEKVDITTIVFGNENLKDYYKTIDEIGEDYDLRFEDNLKKVSDNSAMSQKSIYNIRHECRWNVLKDGGYLV